MMVFSAVALLDFKETVFNVKISMNVSLVIICAPSILTVLIYQGLLVAIVNQDFMETELHVTKLMNVQLELIIVPKMLRVQILKAHLLADVLKGFK